MSSSSNNPNPLLENFEMLKALYDFQAVYPKTISFDEGEYFILHQTSARQRNWWQVVSMKGNVGFVPSNYVMRLKVEPEFIVGFLESSIESLRLSKEVEINGIIAREELIVKLEERKKTIEDAIEAQRGGDGESSLSYNEIAGYEESYSPTPVTNPEEKRRESSTAATSEAVVSNGRLKNAETHLAENCPPTRDISCPDENHHNYTSTPTPKPELTKKSMSSPAVGAQLPQLVSESPSMSVLTPKLETDATTPSPSSTVKTITPGNVAVSSHQDNSITSEPSDTTTTITTSDEITTVSNRGITTSELNKDQVSDSCNVSGNEAKSEGEESVMENCVSATADGNAENSEKSEKFAVSEQDVYQIVDSVRQNTNLSHELSCVALRIVLSELGSILPPHILPFLEPMAVHLAGPMSAPENLLGETHDAQRLRIIFADLADCKNDTEQRSWMLYEDEEDISRFLRELIAILSLADPKICRHEMSIDQYQSTMNLVLYYQMETRWSIRRLLLDALKAMCFLDFTAVNIMLSSILPIELVEDMKVSVTKVARLKELATVLVIIFSIGQKMPVTHEENLGTDFVLFLLTIIETPPDEDTMGVLPDVMINLLLSFNLQFDDCTNNIVLEALRKITDAKNFTEKILLLINREEDPINILSHTSPPVNSVLKMFVDLFSTKETAALFYTNDNKVLIDILVRQLSDLSPGDQLRRWYLELCRRILRNTDYAEHTHRKQDLMKIFTRIFCEEGECSLKDQQLVREIANEFPQIFKA